MPSINPKGVFFSVNKIYTLMKNQHSARENGVISVTKNLSVRGNFRKVEIFKSLHGQNRKKTKLPHLEQKIAYRSKILLKCP